METAGFCNRIVLKVKAGCAGWAVGGSRCASEDGYVSADTCSDSENSQNHSLTSKLGMKLFPNYIILVKILDKFFF